MSRVSKEHAEGHLGFWTRKLRILLKKRGGERIWRRKGQPGKGYEKSELWALISTKSVERGTGT